MAGLFSDEDEASVIPEMLSYIGLEEKLSRDFPKMNLDELTMSYVSATRAISNLDFFRGRIDDTAKKANVTLVWAEKYTKDMNTYFDSLRK